MSASINNNLKESRLDIREQVPAEVISNVGLLAVSVLAVLGFSRARPAGFSRSIAIISGLNLGIAMYGATNKAHTYQATVDYSLPISGGVLGMTGLIPASQVAWFVIVPMVARNVVQAYFSSSNENATDSNVKG